MNQSKVDPEPFEYTYYDYSDWYSNNQEPTKPPIKVIQPCDPTADDRIFHVSVLSISLVMMLVLAVLNRKHKLCGGFARGSSGIFSAVNFLDQTQSKGPAMAVFGLVFSRLAVLVLSPDPLPFLKDTPAEMKEYMKILSVFYYPLLYYPLLVCCTLQHRAGYAFGSLLALSHFGVLFWQKVDCPETTEIYAYYALLASLPQLACLAYLCVQFPLLFFKGPETEEDLDSKYYQDYVKALLKKKPSISSSINIDKPKLSERLLEAVKGYIYTPDKVFRFPLKMSISAFVALVAMYHVALLLVVLVVPVLHIVRAGIDQDIAFLLMGFNIILSEDKAEVVQIVTYYTWLLEVCYLCAMTLACMVSLAMLMRSMVLNRANLRGLYRGDIYSVYSCQKTIRPSKPGVVCWMGLTGYHAAIVSIGMVIQTLVFFICFLFLVFLIIVPVFYGRNLILFQISAKAWPAWVTLVVVTAIQHVAAHFAFIKKDGGTTDLNNRGSLFLLTYMLYLLNTAVGLVVGIWRMVITALYNILHLGRIDISLLHRSAESYDPAYRYYAHFLKVEVNQSHPVLKAFCGLLLDIQILKGGAAKKIRDAEEGIQRVQPNRLAPAAQRKRLCVRWQLLYTLVNNASLLGSRKHFQVQASSAEAGLNGALRRGSVRAGGTRETSPGPGASEAGELEVEAPAS
ncbi:receptor for retinol uptake stra6-like [Gadus macrocephalus]|uniref:receptor for retinol uptake stra6-like n=1 Tax=Gadus macrocephalus TaxID=80720 RepID=UPI0028CB6C98|nr:receptor for retinol uptake stra6-like [Gadus macrocephalus]